MVRRPGRPTAEVVLSGEERAVLERWARRPKSAQSLVLRCRIVLGAAGGESNKDIAARLGCNPATVGKWRSRFAELRLDGLHDEPRPGKPRTITDDDVERVVVKTLEEQPAGATHWSTYSMAAATGMSQTAVSRIWRAFGLKPHLAEDFKLSPDPQFIDKVRDIVALYLNPPDAAVVLCVDEKTQVQALDRTAPVLPLLPGVPERRTHDYRRNGTTNLYAALDVASGNVIASFTARHRAAEFLRFLKLIDASVPADLAVHVVLDNVSTHKTPAVQRWLVKHGDTWTWDGTAWTQRPTSPSPSNRSYPAMARDPLGGVLLFGGNYTNETWRFTDTGVPNVRDVDPTIPPIPPVTIPPIPPIPPIPSVSPPPGGTTFASDECTSGTVVADGFVGDGYARVRMQRPSADTTWVCVRIDSSTIAFGGKFVVSAPGASAGPLPSTDGNADACTTTAGNTVPGQHPIFSGAVGDPNDPPYVPFLVDAFRNGTGAWVCVRAGSVNVRVVVPVGVSLTPPNVAFVPDVNGRDADVLTPPSTPSGTCQASGQGTRHVDTVVGGSRVFAYTWTPSAGVTKVCVRTSGAVTAGGVLTVDTASIGGALPNVTTGDDLTPCTTQVVHLDNPAVDVRRSATGAFPASVCVRAGTQTLRVTVSTGNGQVPSVVRWEPDPGTP